MTLQLVDELLFIETVNLLRNISLVMTQCCDDTMNQGEALKESTNLMDSPAHSPALGHQFLNLLRIDHDGQARASKIVSQTLPRYGLTSLNHDGKHHNLNVSKTQFLT